MSQFRDPLENLVCQLLPTTTEVLIPAVPLSNLMGRQAGGRYPGPRLLTKSLHLGWILLPGAQVLLHAVNVVKQRTYLTIHERFLIHHRAGQKGQAMGAGLATEHLDHQDLWQALSAALAELLPRGCAAGTLETAAIGLS